MIKILHSAHLFGLKIHATLFLTLVFTLLNISTSQTTIPGAYERPENIFCLDFTGDDCNECAWSLDYYLYGNVCSKFQNKPTNLHQSGPIPKIFRGELFCEYYKS